MLTGAGKWLRTAEKMVVEPIFRLITTTLLSLLLPLSFLLLSRLSSAALIPSPPSPSPEYSLLFSIFLYTNPTILHAVVSFITIYTLIIGFTSKITSTNPNCSLLFYPRVSIAWLILLLVQISVGLGLEATISFSEEFNGLIIGNERSFVSKLVFFFGLHEVMLLWYRLIVKPVVNNTLTGGGGGGGAGETAVERVALAVSCGTLWWWKLRDEIEGLVGVVEAKRELLLLLLPINEIGPTDFMNWWLYYMVVTIGMVRIVKGCLWFGLILLFEQGRRNQCDVINEVDDKV